MVAIEEGRFEPGLEALDAVLSKFQASESAFHDYSSPQVGSVQTKVKASDLWIDWPDSAGVGCLLGAPTNQARRMATRLRSKGQLLGVCLPGDHRRRFPPCQFFNGTVVPVMQDLIQALPDGSGSGWIKAFWLYSENPKLSGSRPAELLAESPEAVLAAARALPQPQAYFGW
jgi:hypothetical protein